MENLWQRFVNRQRRILAEVARIQLEMAQENPRAAPTLFPRGPYKISTVILFCVFAFFVAVAAWVSVRELAISSFR
jgi:hypothetical protein